MKKNIILFIILFSLGIIVTYPSFASSHALDSYCTIYNGYNDTAIWFLQNGRIFSALLFWFYGLVNFPFDSMRFLSSFFANAFLAISILCLYNKMNTNLKDNKVIKGILFVSLFLVFYNPLFTEVLILDETCVIALGLLLLTLASIKIYEGGICNYFLALVLAILGITCYQGIGGYLIVIPLMLFITDRDNNIKDIVKRFVISILIYGISFILNFGIIKLVSNIVSKNMPKLGHFDIVGNISLIINDLFPNSVHYLFGFVNINIYYAFVFILFVLCVYLIIKNDNKKNTTFLLILAVLSCLFVPFIPNVFMDSNSSYTAARMALTIMAVPSILVIYIISLADGMKLGYVLLGITILLFSFYAYSIHQNTMINFKRFKEDVKYINNISDHIKWYEHENKIKVKTIYYAKDTAVDYYYSFGNANGANIRLLAVDWGLECAFPVYTENKYKIKKMSKVDYEKYFADKNYNKFSSKELKFVDDKLYLLLY